VLADEKVSRRHAIIHAQGDLEFWLVDLGSSNGTYLNGHRVSQPVRLADLATIQVGSFLLTFRQSRSGSRGHEQSATQQTVMDIRSTACFLLLADIEKSTQLIHLYSAKQLPVVTGSWFSKCKQLIEKHGGTINKYLGDGFFAY
jgi:pSer/pThr/pTyr-binding forkhead associated (FHA) protein